LWDKTMTLLQGYHEPGGLNDRLHDADAVTSELMAEIVVTTCRRFPPIRSTGKTARIARLIGSEAWTDAALALIDLELPQWQVRRIVYDEDEWHCALSRQRALPDWLDQAIEAHHADLPLAILAAFVEARHVTAPSNRTSVPPAPWRAELRCEPVCCDNFA
jgi:hypothetical protein